MNTIIRAAVTLSSVALAAGCHSIVRENVLSSIQTGLGVTVAQNPQTELYEAKVGYVRSQFYSIPTGKNVSPPEGGEPSNEADVTPELVAGIQVKSSWQNLLFGLDISESFAVGRTAVNSKAATAMYVSSAPDTGQAHAAAEALKASRTTAQFGDLKADAIYAALEGLVTTPGPHQDDAVLLKSKADGLASAVVPAAYAVGIRNVDRNQVLQDPDPAAGAPFPSGGSRYRDLRTYLDQLEGSAQKLRDAVRGTIRHGNASVDTLANELAATYTEIARIRGWLPDIEDALRGAVVLLGK